MLIDFCPKVQAADDNCTRRKNWALIATITVLRDISNAPTAGDQDAFWEYHDTLFENYGGENRRTFNQENLKSFAETLGLDGESFGECLDSGKYTQTVESETSAARQFGVPSTPPFLVNGQPIVGTQSFEVFRQVIEQKLNK